MPIAMAVGADLAILFILLGNPGPFLVVLVGLLVAMAATYPAVRQARAEVITDQMGLHVKNVWRDGDLRWDEVSKVDVGPFGIYPSVLRIHLVDGRTVAAMGIAERPRFATGRAKQIAFAIEGELKIRRTWPGSAG